MSINDRRKISELIKLAEGDADRVSCFFYGDVQESPEGAVFVVKGSELAELIVKWFESQKLLHLKPIGHTCHWPDCNESVPPKMWGCKKHWFKLPKSLRDKIWSVYVPGQEITKTPSAEYIQVAREAQQWIAANF